LQVRESPALQELRAVLHIKAADWLDVIYDNLGIKVLPPRHIAGHQPFNVLA
jgi:hypothetical protein